MTRGLFPVRRHGFGAAGWLWVLLLAVGGAGAGAAAEGQARPASWAEAMAAARSALGGLQRPKKGLDHRAPQASNRPMETGAYDSSFVGHYLLRPKTFRLNK